MTTQSNWPHGTPERRAEIEAHWAKVRAGIRNDMPEPEYKTPREVLQMHCYLSSERLRQASWHLRQAKIAAGEAECT